MDYEDMIEDEPQPAEETPPEGEIDGDDVAELDEVSEPRAGSPWKAFILTGVLAGLIGAAGGGYGAFSALKNNAPAPVAQPDIDLSPIEAKLKKLTARVKAAETQVQTLSDRPAMAAAAAAPVDLTDVEARLTALEAAPSPEIDPAALTALQSAQKDGFDWPDVSTLERRIEALETHPPSAADLPEDVSARLTALETDLESARTAKTAPADTADVLSDMETRLTALENRPAPAPIVEHVSILAFPKAQLIEAVEANLEGGLIEKTLSRHIRVKDDNDPLTLIDAIEDDLSKGRLAPAAKKFERLPKPVRAAGQAWFESVKASL